MLIALGAFLTGALAIAVTEWLRHRPHRLTESTQLLALVGYALAFAAWGTGLGLAVGRLLTDSR